VLWGKITDGGDVVVEQCWLGKRGRERERERCAQLGRGNEFFVASVDTPLSFR